VRPSTLFDLHRLEAGTFVGRVEFHEELASTNTRALELAAAEKSAATLLVLAERQTAGRGRGSNRWWAGDGALTFSLLLETAAAQIGVERWPLVSLTVGLAVCEAISELLPEHQVGLKWPNDVFLNRRKVCGILVEVPPDGSGRLVIGVGINVNNSFADAPPELRGIATSLLDTANLNHDMTDFLVHVLRHLGRRLQTFGDQPGSLADEWRQYCILHGCNVHLETGGARTVGLCRGIDDFGALLLQTEQGLQRFFGGVVAYYE
jgi:BirA family biotin operon repressor/biotin-[acetyl-CoA-carboxylase] ligase